MINVSFYTVSSNYSVSNQRQSLVDNIMNSILTTIAKSIVHEREKIGDDSLFLSSCGLLDYYQMRPGKTNKLKQMETTKNKTE